MAQHASAAKQARKAIKNHARNQHDMSTIRTAIKRVRDEKEKPKAEVALKRAVKLLDKMSAKGLIHKNKAANQKSRLMKVVATIK